MGAPTIEVPPGDEGRLQKGESESGANRKLLAQLATWTTSFPLVVSFVHQEDGISLYLPPLLGEWNEVMQAKGSEKLWRAL